MDEREKLMHQSLELMNTAAVIVSDNGEVLWKNSAAAPLKLTVGRSVETSVRDFTRQFAAWDYHRNYRLTVDVLGKPWVMTAARLGSVNLLLFAPETEDDSTVQTVMLSLFHGMDSVATDLIHAIRELAPELEEENDPVLDRKLAAVTRSSFRLVRNATNMAELGRLGYEKEAVLPKEVPLRSFFERLAEKEAGILRDCGVELKIQLAIRDTQFGNVDPLIAEKVIAMLLCNAVKYGKSGEPITLRVASDEKTVRISVTNRGSGIDGDTLATAFTRYLQTPDVNDRHTGAGMGLAVVRELAMRHGGATVIRSGEDGAMFVVSLDITMPAVTASHTPLLASAFLYDASLVELSDILPLDTFLSYAVEC